MTTVREFHDRAMRLADDLLLARHRGRRKEADRLAREAFAAELQAATIAFDRDVSAVTRVILLRSVANLAREAKRWEDAIDLAIRALSAEDLVDHRSELFRIVDTLRTYEHLGLHGVTLADTEVQLSVAGAVAAPGFARSDEVTRRVGFVHDLMVRTAMRKLKMPYEDSAPRTRYFKEIFTPFMSEARAASFAVTLKFGVGEQVELALLGDNESPASKRRPPSVSKVLDAVIASARAYAEGGPSALRKLIRDESYARNAASLLRQLSPDAERISTVGLTVLRGGQSAPVALPNRDAFDTRIRVTARGLAEALPPYESTFVGQLLEADARHPARSRAAIVLDDGRNIPFRYDEPTHGDIVASYWKHRVAIRLRREGAQGYVLLHVDDA